MGELRVSPAELSTSGRTLAAVAEDLAQAHHRVESLRAEGLGSRRIDAALDEFADHWHYAMRTMAKKVSQASNSLLAAGTTYEDLEKALSRELEGH